MERTLAKSPRAAVALALVEDLQRRFASLLEAAVGAAATSERFRPIEWFRDQGRHGGGVRLAAVETPAFNRASINVSSVHYDDEPDKRLSSATALSTIIHPQHPRCPSVHVHLSWTEMRDGSGYWRVMADLNPSIEVAEQTRAFDDLLRAAGGLRYEHGLAQGEKYFFIPCAGRHRGVAHFYLEGYTTGDFEADEAYVRRFGEVVLGGYAGILKEAASLLSPPTDDECRAQLAYHTLYFLQVLTLDRGTTSGLLVHDQNDVGILGSLPAYVDRGLLESWIAKQPTPQDELLRGLVGVLPDVHPCPVTDDVRAELAAVVRSHYRAHPSAIGLQASGDVIPPTVANHEPVD